MKIGTFLGGLLLGAGLSAAAMMSWNGQANLSGMFASNTQVEAPVLPADVFTAHEDYYGSSMRGFLTGIWVLVLEWIKSDYPDIRSAEVYYKRGLELGRLPDNDGKSLMAALKASAEEKGWEEVPEYRVSGMPFVMRGFRQHGKVFVVLAFDNRLHYGAEGVRFSASESAGVDKPDVLPIFVFTNLEFADGSLPWIDPDAPVLSYKDGQEQWVSQE